MIVNSLGRYLPLSEIMKQPDRLFEWVALAREVSVIRAGDQEHGGGRAVFCWHATYR